MRRSLGAILVLAGAFCLFQFAVLGTWHGRHLEAPLWKLPLLSLSENYPTNAGWLAGAVIALLVGVGIGLRKDSQVGGGVARVLLVESIGIFGMLFLAYVGARSITEETRATVLPMIGVFFGTALLQIAAGLILLIFALFEKPRGVLSLTLGTVLYLGAAAAGVLGFVWGTQ